MDTKQKLNQVEARAKLETKRDFAKKSFNRAVSMFRRLPNSENWQNMKVIMYAYQDAILGHSNGHDTFSDCLEYAVKNANRLQ